MRYIKKTLAPKFLEEFKQNFRLKTGQEPTYKTLGGIKYHKYKDKLKDHLLYEQRNLCCYCMKSIDHENCHIEHFKPQSKFPDLTLDYGNMMLSCNGITNHYENCGHKKADWYEEEVTISPLDSDCEKNFNYTIDGRILPNNPDAKETIEVLELDSYLLQRARQTAIEYSGFFEEDIDETKEELIRFYKTPSRGKLPPFCTAMIYCLEHFL
jgi:TIGR02646 family protein